ncbi:MAG: hypothetical protein J2P25_24140, partial [Nocardiopsaceae bacterium]|nr:hypothetical protein [Nocardiopsaceae bacterium]
MSRPVVTGIEVSGLRVAGYGLTPDPYGVAAGQAGIVVAPEEVRRELADVLTGLAAPAAGEV